ncbi:MAG TPA: TonB-dependent receptor, partial [Gemmatimonadales bacterium]|nr:TonB-dependent receptor [Gemmatimonadales bacterium]
MTRRAWTAACFLAAAAPLAAQSTGAISGTVRDASSGRPLASALVTIEEGRRGAVTDATGGFRIREVRSGWHRVRAALIGYQPIVRDSVLVRAGGTIVLDLTLRPAAVEVESLIVHADVDPLLDPLATPTEQKVTAEEIRRLPISSLEEAIALSAGAVGESYRGGRLGQQSFILDGFGLKNQLDASTGDLGLRIPPDILTEASLVTNAFSARYGQALSGMINVVTRDGGDIWHGRAAYETDRPLGESGDYGLDRIILQGDGPLFAGVRFVGVVDAAGRLDADPVSAPRPSDELDPRSEGAAILPHNSGERLDLAAKLTIPLGARQTVRLFGLRSVEQRLLYDQQYKYDVSFAPAQRLSGTLLTGHLQHASSPTARLPLVADLRLGWYEKEFTRGELEDEPDYRFGAFTGSTYRIKGEDLARAQ